MRRALLVFPSYYVEGLDPVVQHTLLQCGVIPIDLKEYRLTGASKDCDMFTQKVLGTGIQIKVLCGVVYRTAVLTELSWLLEPGVEVATLLFCGHGTSTTDADPLRHGALVCSYNQLVSAEDIDILAMARQFEGTFVRVLNLCGTRAVSRHDAATQRKSVSHRDVVVLADRPPGELARCSDGSAFVAALVRLLEVEPLVTYKRLEEAMGRQWPGGGVRVSLHPEGLIGTFGGPAFRV